MITVSATVVDNATGQGIPGATIAVNGKVVGIADTDGYFEVPANSYSDMLTVTSVGYDPVTLSADGADSAGLVRMQINADNLAAATVTPSGSAKAGYWPLVILGGVVVMASSSRRRPSRAVSGKGSNLVPIALVGAGALLLLQRRSGSALPGSTPTAPYTPVTNPTSGNGSLFNPTNITNLANIFKGLFGGSSSPSTDPGVSSPWDTSYDPSTDLSTIDTAMAGMGATTTLNAGDILGKTLVAAEQVPLYDTPRDDAQPSGYVSKGNPIGIVYSYLNPDTSQGRAELWWMFEPLPGNSDIGDNLGYYYVPHNPDYFDTQALLDAGVLTVAQATALKQSQGTSSTLDSYIKKYGPWVAGILIAGVAVKSVINKAL